MRSRSATLGYHNPPEDVRIVWRPDEELGLVPVAVDGRTGREIAVSWAAQPGSQDAILTCPVFEALIEGPRGTGKGLPLDEPVICPMGERRIGDLKVNDRVCAPDGTISRVIAVFPQGERPVYEIEFDDGAIARCDDVHIWPVRVQGDEIKRGFDYRLYAMPRVLELFSKGRRLHIPVLEDVRFQSAPRASLPVEPYLLGLLLGDGSFTQGRVLYCTMDDQLAETVIQAGSKESPPDKRNGLRNFRMPHLRDAIRRLGLRDCVSGTKFVPRRYLFAPRPIRLAVLQGLMDTDGTVSKGKASFCSKSEQMARDVQWLVRSLGGKATLRSKKNAFDVYIQPGDAFNPFRLVRKRDAWTPYQHGRVWRRIVDIRRVATQETVCIKVDHPSGLFMTRDFVVTHNTDSFLMSFGQYVGRGYDRDWRGIIFRRTFPELEDIIEKSKKFFPRIWPDASYNEQKHTWTWPKGESLRFRFIQKPGDYYQYHGHSYPFIGFEELTTWPDPSCYLVMMSCSRSARPGMPRMYRSTTNPYGPGHSWVKSRFGLPVAAGRVIGPIIRGDDPNSPARVAIHSTLAENRVLMYADPHYVKRIEEAARNESERKAWVEGSWDIVSGGMFDDVWDASVNVVPEFHIPRTWKIDRSFDWGSSSPSSVGWWAESDGSDLRLPDGRVISTVRGDLFRIREWYIWDGNEQHPKGVKMLATDIARGIVEREIEWGLHGRVRPGPADSSIFDVENGVSIARDMEQPVRIDGRQYRGVQWERADKRPGSRKSGWEMMRKMIRDAAGQEEELADGTTRRLPRERPGLFVCDTCRQFIRTVPVLSRDQADPDDVDTHTEDHIADEARYRVRRVGIVTKSGTTKGMY